MEVVEVEEHLDIFGSAGGIVGEAARNTNTATPRSSQEGQDAQNTTRQDAATPAPRRQMAHPPSLNKVPAKSRLDDKAWNTATRHVAPGNEGGEPPSAAVPRAISINKHVVRGWVRVLSMHRRNSCIVT